MMIIRLYDGDNAILRYNEGGNVTITMLKLEPYGRENMILYCTI